MDYFKFKVGDIVTVEINSYVLNKWKNLYGIRGDVFRITELINDVVPCVKFESLNGIQYPYSITQYKVERANAVDVAKAKIQNEF